MKNRYAVLLLGLSILQASAAQGDNPPASTDSIENSDVAGGPTHIVIHPASSDREGVSTAVGSSSYQLNNQSISELPQGPFTPLNETLLQTPGVAQDSYGQLHIRGDHADLQYRINGIILPEGITGFGQAFDTHFADKIELLTGALPAQYGYRTAGIIDITTKTGSFDNGGTSSVMVGSNNTFEANQEFYGSREHLNYFFTGNYLQDDHGIEPPTSASHPFHDDTTQDKQFGYMSYAFSPETQLSVIVGNSTNRFEIPNNPGQPQNFALQGTPGYNSLSINENQYEHNTYAIAALKGSYNDDAQYQFAFFTRDSTVLFKPDPMGDLIFNGIASRDYSESFTNGIQNDNSYRLNDQHTLRAGWYASYEQATSDSDSLVFPADASGAQSSDVPFSVLDNDYQIARLAGIYLQDEWKTTDKLTVNYGARFDSYSAYVNDSQLSPRLGLVYDATSSTRLHTGYARYFTPPPTELIAPVAIQSFAGTTAATPTGQSSSVQPESDNYFDAGVIQKIGHDLSFGVDAYYKQAHNLLDEGQFGQALIYAPFNYEKGWVKGIELTGDYHKGAFTSYANLAVSQALGKDVVSGQYNFTQAELDYIDSNAVHLDHDQLISGSAGASYTYKEINYSADMLYGSGLRSGFANTDHLPFYSQVNLGVEHNFDFGPKSGTLDAKFSVINLFDRVYEIRDGSGIGVFAPQYGPRRGIFLTLSKPFNW